MTNKDVIESLMIIHDALDEIRELSWVDDVKTKHLRTYLTLIENKLDPLHEHLLKHFESKD